MTKGTWLTMTTGVTAEMFNAYFASVFTKEIVPLGNNKHVTEGHLTLFANTFPNFSQSISNIHDFFIMVCALPF